MKNPVSTFRSIALLTVLLTGIISSAFTDQLDNGRTALFVAYILMGIGGAYLLGASRRWHFAAWSLVVPMIVIESIRIGTGTESTSLNAAGELFSMGLNGLLLVVVLTYSLLAEETIHKTDRVLAGICGYLLIALLWSNLFAAIEIFAAGSFLDSQGAELERTDLLYFSLTSLTTLGYGDVLPLTAPARIFSVLESVFGVLYLAVFISTLIAIPNKQQK